MKTKSNSTPQIIINGNHANFTGNTFINNLECNIKLDRLGKRELNNLYKSSESVRNAAKKKAQEKYFDEVENYLYKSIGEVIRLMKENVKKDNKNLSLIDSAQLPRFKYDDCSNGMGDLERALTTLCIPILSQVTNLNEADIKRAFIENPCSLFREEEKDGLQVSYKVENDNIYKVVKELA